MKAVGEFAADDNDGTGMMEGVVVVEHSVSGGVKRFTKSGDVMVRKV